MAPLERRSEGRRTRRFDRSSRYLLYVLLSLRGGAHVCAERRRQGADFGCCIAAANGGRWPVLKTAAAGRATIFGCSLQRPTDCRRCSKCYTSVHAAPLCSRFALADYAPRSRSRLRSRATRKTIDARRQQPAADANPLSFTQAENARRRRSRCFRHFGGTRRSCFCIERSARSPADSKDAAKLRL